MTLLGLGDGDEGTYTDIAEVIRMHSSAPTEDLHELWGRIVFNVVIGNLDDHLRNHGFLYDPDNKWRLSPADDLNPVPPTAKARKLSTWISEEGPDADLGLARNAAPCFALDMGRANVIIDEVIPALDGWKDIARRLRMSASDLAAHATAIRDTAWYRRRIARLSAAGTSLDLLTALLYPKRRRRGQHRDRSGRRISAGSAETADGERQSGRRPHRRRSGTAT